MIPNSLSYEYKKGHPFVVCIHGLGLNKETFIPFLKSGNIDNFGFLIVDLPGHGKSKSFKNYTFDNITNQLYKLILSLDIDEFHLILHSFASLLIPFLPKFKLKVSSIVMIEGNLTMDDSKWTSYLSNLKREKVYIHHEILKNNKISFPSLKNREKEKKLSKYIIEGINKLDTNFLFDIPKEVTEMTKNKSIFNCLNDKKEKLFYIKGDDQRYWENTKKLLKKLKINFKKIPNSTHYPHLEQPDLTSEVIKLFIFNKI